MSAGDEMDPRLRSAFEAMREESAGAPDQGALVAARAAMHQARATLPRRSGLALLAERLRLALSPRLLMATGGTLVAGLAAVAVIGWNAPAGTPLHGIRVAHESLQLNFPGADRVALDLDYAESRMADAQRSSGSWTSSLDEAGRFLDDARRHLDSGSSLWSRWENDESRLAGLRRHDGDDNGTAPSNPGENESESESSTQPGGASGEGGDDRGSSSSTSTQSVEQHESTSSSEEHSSTSASSTSSQSGDGGGGGDGGSSSSSSSGSTSSSSDGGGSGGSGGSDG